MRTPEEIKAKIKEWLDTDFFGFKVGDLIHYLPFEEVKEFLKPGVTEEQWESNTCSDEAVKKEMIDYMPFAWDKANNCRGLSAGRSMSHYQAWVWLLGDEAVAKLGDLEEYEYYGKDNLVKLCDFLGLDSKEWDDGIRSNTED